VEFALDLDPYTNGKALDARIEGGTAILSGTVDSMFEKAEAESAAAGVPGVREIDNRISVRNPSLVVVSSPFLAHFGRSSAIATDLALEIGWSPFLDPRSIQTKVRDGRARLTGSVPSWQAWHAASNAAFDAGAIAVDNRLVVRGSR
jgi:osmotically-inducible protein OsmY